jgi:hypothetical protein
MPRVTEARVTAVSPGLLDLVPSIQRHLKAERKAPQTVDSYSEAVRRLHDFLAEQRQGSYAPGPVLQSRTGSAATRPCPGWI